MEQVSPENLPEEFGGTCKCPGGCELSDMGPWQEAEWTRTPKWATPKADEAAPKAEEAAQKEAEA